MTLRVLHVPFAVAGNAPMLADAERELGLDSECIVLEGSGARRELERWRLLLRAVRRADVVHFDFGSTFTARDGTERRGLSVVDALMQCRAEVQRSCWPSSWEGAG